MLGGRFVNKRLLIFFTTVLLLIVASNVSAKEDNILVYVNGNVIEDTNIINIKNGESYISIKSVIEAIGGTYNWDKTDEKIYFTYNNVTYVLKQYNYNGFVKEEYNHNEEIRNLEYRVYANPKHKLVQDGIIKISDHRASCQVFIFNNNVYFSLERDYIKKLLNSLDYSFEKKGNEIKIDKVNLNKSEFLNAVEKGMTKEDFFSKISDEYNDYFAYTGNFKDNNMGFEVDYYLENNSIIELYFKLDNEIYVLESVKQLTCDGMLIENIIG